MQLGDLMMWAALIITAGAIAAYVFAALGRRELTSLGRTGYFASASALTIIFAYFMWLILKNHFEVDYIYNNSSKDLPLLYKISVFWAGQQGSFLLWAFLGAILGVFVMRKAREFEPWLMAVWGTVQGLFLVLLLIDSPFKLLPGPPEMLAEITDGRGLRELLQNPWMAIHPPATFIGYAAMCVPAAFAIAALIRGDFRTWCRTTLPWAIFGWLTLGAGIILGAYWAYEVLGWGGYWKWDPVENASLVPWLTGTALLHGMLAERCRGSFRRANVVLALITFLFVFYATYLTRSDALKDFSVHTFGGTSIGLPLLCFMGAFVLFSAALALWRWGEIESMPSYTAILSKDFLFFLAIILFVASAALVAIGTSAPIIGRLASHVPILRSIIPARITLDQVFYNRTHAPIALVVLALMALAPITAWRRSSAGRGWREPGLILAVAAGLVVGLTFLAAAVAPRLLGRQSLYLWIFAVVIALMALAGLVSNARALWRTKKLGLRMVGGFAAHAGISILFLGMILSANSRNANNVVLQANGKAVSALGYRFTYQGREKIGEHKDILKIRIERGRTAIDAKAVTEITRENEFYPHPYIIKTFARDLYIAPKAISGMEQKVLGRGGKPVEVQDFKLRFVDFVLPEGHGRGDMRIGARLESEVDGKREILTPFLVSKRAPEPPRFDVEIPGQAASIHVDRINVEEKAVYVTLTTADGKEQSLRLRQGEQVTVGDYRLIFKKWFLPQPEGGHSGDFRVTVQIEVSSKGRTAAVEPVYRPRESAEATVVSEPVPVPGVEFAAALTDVDLRNGRVLVTLTPTVESAVFDVSVKPMISLLWIGSIIALVGGAIAVWRRNAELSLAEAAAVDEVPEPEPVKV